MGRKTSDDVVLALADAPIDSRTGNRVLYSVNWVADRGDPRYPGVDVVDWIEMIPFRETRNYVMRVTESIPVYRARLTGRVDDLKFTELLHGTPN